ncbi:MAG: hypothetical protein HKN20_00245, partial [Gemmatimonadetes bacterium]|nr:hypothetical protein [Gemmatimonadota bacterium]
FRPLIERPEGAGPDSFDGLDWIWLPSVRALSESDAERLRRYVKEGGRILAAGHEPGTHDRHGKPRERALLTDLFPAWNDHDRATHVGNGFALARPGLTPEALFDTGARGDSIRAALSMNVKPHVDPVVRVEQDRVYLEIIRRVEGENRQSVALVDLIGVQRPVAPPDRLLTVHFRPPADARRITAHVSGPGRDDRRIPVERGGSGGSRDEFVSLSVRATPFAFVTFRWETAVSDPPVLSSRRGEVPSWLAEPIESAMTFVKESMRNASLPEPWRFGVHTNLAHYAKREDDTYVYGDYVTTEHMGLALRAAALTGDHALFAESERFVREVMCSRVFGVLNWATDENARAPHTEEADIGRIQANAPFDDLRIVRGLHEGAEAFGDPAADAFADRVARALYETSVVNVPVEGVPRALIAYAFDFLELGADSTDVASRSGFGFRNGDPAPGSYQDLHTIGGMARRDPRWRRVLRDATDFLLAAEIGTSGLFWGGWSTRENSWIGDFEYRDDPRGLHLKTIQVVWMAIHLAEAAHAHSDLIGPARTGEAVFAAQRTLRFFQDYYETHGRVPEYLTVGGSAVEDCPEGEGSRNGSSLGLPCLRAGEENLTDGDARIDALLARLALVLEERRWAARIARERILPDRVTDREDPRYGLIGKRSVDPDDAAAWNVLESIITLQMLAEEAEEAEES